MPPPPAQRSMTVSPDLAPASRLTSCEPSSWISTRPSRKAGSDYTDGLAILEMPEPRPDGECGVGRAADAKGCQRLPALAFQSVDAQIERRARRQGLRFGDEVHAELARRAGSAIREIPGHMGGRLGESGRAGVELRMLRLDQRRRREARAVEKARWCPGSCRERARAFREGQRAKAPRPCPESP